MDLIQRLVDEHQRSLAEVRVTATPVLVHPLELDPRDVDREVVEARLVGLVADHEHRVRTEDVEVLPHGQR